MAELGTMKLGSHLAFILCILFLESRLHLIKAIDIPPKRLCSEDVLVLLQQLSSSPCKVTNETDIIINNRVQDEQNCLVSCNIEGSITPMSDSNSPCQSKDECTVSDSIGEEESRLALQLSKQFFFCCDNSRREVSIKGSCDYTVYITDKDSLKLGERCISEEQCHGRTLTCLKSRCSCNDGYIEYDGQCWRAEVRYGDQCMHSFQCTFVGGVCSTSRFCSCRSDLVYVKSNAECVSAKKLGENCESDEQCGTTFYQMQCLRNQCSCIDGYTILQGHCYKKSLSFGNECLVTKQCAYHGGYCNRTCSCGYDYELYSWKNNSCMRAWNLQIGDKCTLDSQCGGTDNSMICASRECACNTGYIQLHGMCLKAWKLQVGDACTLDRQCGGTENSMICSSRECACNTGYIQLHGICLKGGLQLGKSCIISHQCSGSQFPLICDTSDHCACSPEYIYDDSAQTCLKDVNHNGRPEMQQSDSDQDTVVVGAAVGSLVIGVIIGVMTTLGAMFLLKRSRAKKDCDTKKPSVGRHEVYEEKLQMVSKQDTYEQIGSVEEKSNTMKDVVINSENVYHVVEPTPSAPIEDKVNKQEEESVYNHLFEKVEQSETSTYDNPHEICAGRDNQAFVEERKAQNAGHDNQAFVEERMSRDTSLPEEDKLAGFDRGCPNVTNRNSESDDYFVLECNK